MKSMTGFGKATATLPDGTEVTVIVRGVNHRFLDVAVKLRDELSGFEPRLRKMVGEVASRGHVDVLVRSFRPLGRTAGFEVQANVKSYHLWLTLPPHWRSQTFVAAAARRDIALTPSTTFAVTPGHAPNAVRLALGAPSTEQLDLALRTLSGMLTAKEDVDTTE